MPTLRIAMGHPLPGEKQELDRLSDELLEWFSHQEGFIFGFRFSATDGSGETGRLSLWKTEEQADRLLASEHMMALRARIHRLLQPGHREHIYRIEGAPQDPRHLLGS